MTKKSLIILILSALTLVMLPAQQPLKVTLVWNANPEPDIAGYRAYYRDVNGPVTPIVLDGRDTSREIFLSNANARYEFWVTAYNTAGLESNPSSKVTYDTPLFQPSKVGNPDALIVP